MSGKSILIFGAGKIGRSFIGQLFGRAGYEVVFSDVDKALIEALNRHGSYRVILKGETDETITVHNVRAIDGYDPEQVVEEISRASIMAVSVGKNFLGEIIPLIAKGIERRHADFPGKPVDLILAENMRDAKAFVYNGLCGYLPNGFPLRTTLGLVETSIGKMVPIMTEEDIRKDLLAVFAEPYNQLIVDKHGFLGGIPEVEGLVPKNNIAAWVDRKAFIHNMGHAATAYYGNYRHPEAKYIYEALEDTDVFAFVCAAMLQSALVLQSVYPSDFTLESLEAHVDDLLRRFRNKALKDTIFRVGQDRIRKLGFDDRFMGIIRLAQQQSMDYSLIVEAMTYAFFFNATDENGNRSEADILFDSYKKRGIAFVLEKVCGLNATNDRYLIRLISNKFADYQTRR